MMISNIFDFQGKGSAVGDRAYPIDRWMNLLESPGLFENFAKEDERIPCVWGVHPISTNKGGDLL